MIASAAVGVLEALRSRGPIKTKTLIVVAHPDDETIGMGAQLCRFRNASLVQITDGAPRDGRDATAYGYRTTENYAFARRAEFYTALAAGQATGVKTEFIGIPDQEACLNLVSLAKCIAGRLRADPADTVFVQPYEGGHPDHDAVSFAVWAACRLIEAEGKPVPAVVEMTGYHAEGAGFVTGVFLPANGSVTILDLNSADCWRKRRMIDSFVSQRHLLAGFGTLIERFREARGYDFTQPPHCGQLYYERLGWNITGADWRHHARAALDVLGL